MAKSDGNDPVEISYEHLVRETVGSLVFEIEGEEHMIPKTQITEHDEQGRTFEIPEWLCYEKGLI